MWQIDCYMADISGVDGLLMATCRIILPLFRIAVLAELYYFRFFFFRLMYWHWSMTLRAWEILFWRIVQNCSTWMSHLACPHMWQTMSDKPRTLVCRDTKYLKRSESHLKKKPLLFQYNLPSSSCSKLHMFSHVTNQKWTNKGDTNADGSSVWSHNQ